MVILFFSSLEQSGSSALLIAARRTPSEHELSYDCRNSNDVNAYGLSPLMWAAWKITKKQDNTALPISTTDVVKWTGRNPDEIG
jgi:hypothetical protein